jgi:hypothetical protein
VNLELDPCRQSSACGQSRESHGLRGIARPARVGQKEKPFRIDKVENVRKRIVFTGEIGAPQRHRHQLCTAGNERVAHQLIGRKLSRADEEPGRELTIGDL